MGVKDFFKIDVKDGSIKDLSLTVDLAGLSGMTIAIDTSYMIYQSALAVQLTDSKGRLTSHMNVILSKINAYAKAGIHQVWIFDSPEGNERKAAENERRRAYRAETGAYKMTTADVESVKGLIHRMGLLYIEVPNGVEAEQYAAAMCRSNVADYVLSGDSDVLMFGGNLLKPIPSAKTNKVAFDSYRLSDILEKTGMSYTQFVQMGVAMGTDFNEKVPRVGPKTVIKRVMAESIDFDEKQLSAIEYFSKPVDKSVAKMTCEPFDAEAVVEYLTDFEFKADRVKKIVTEFEKNTA